MTLSWRHFARCRRRVPQKAPVAIATTILLSVACATATRREAGQHLGKEAQHESEVITATSTLNGGFLEISTLVSRRVCRIESEDGCIQADSVSGVASNSRLTLYGSGCRIEANTNEIGIAHIEASKFGDACDPGFGDFDSLFLRVDGPPRSGHIERHFGSSTSQIKFPEHVLTRLREEIDLSHLRRAAAIIASIERQTASNFDETTASAAKAIALLDGLRQPRSTDAAAFSETMKDLSRWLVAGVKPESEAKRLAELAQASITNAKELLAERPRRTVIAELEDIEKMLDTGRLKEATHRFNDARKILPHIDLGRSSSASAQRLDDVIRVTASRVDQKRALLIRERRSRWDRRWNAAFPQIFDRCDAYWRMEGRRGSGKSQVVQSARAEVDWLVEERQRMVDDGALEEAKTETEGFSTMLWCSFWHRCERDGSDYVHNCPGFGR